jgi:hypothetical protein
MINPSKFEKVSQNSKASIKAQFSIECNTGTKTHYAALPGCAQTVKEKVNLASRHDDQVQGGKFLLGNASNLIISNAKPTRRASMTIKSSGSDSNYFSPFHLLKEKTLSKASQKDKEKIARSKSGDRKEVSLFTHSDAERDNLNLSAHRETLSVFYPNVRSVEHGGAFVKREPILSSHPSMLLAFYNTLKKHDEKKQRRNC